MKQYTIARIRNGKTITFTGTVRDLRAKFDSLLDEGAELRKGNSEYNTVNTNPTTLKSLINNLNKAAQNIYFETGDNICFGHAVDEKGNLL